MSDTPRTDAVSGWAIANHYGQSASSNLLADPKGIFVHAVFARELERENARLREALRECLDGAAYTVSVDALLDPSTRHVGLERLARHRSLLPDAVDVCPDSESALPNVQAQR